MTSPEGGVNPGYDIAGALATAGMNVGPVAEARRVIPQLPETEGQVLEFFSSRAGARLLALPRQGVDRSIHDDLSAVGLPVLPRYPGNPSEDLDMLLVPRGAWALGRQLHNIRKDITRYSDVLWHATRSQVAQYEAGLGVMSPLGDLRAVDHFIFTPDIHTETGQKLYLVPPYTNDPGRTPLDFARGLITELQTSGAFSDKQIDYLTDVVLQGVAGNDER